MARLPRLTIPGLVHHVYQRGNNRQPIVLSVTDYSFFLQLLAEAALQHRIAIHAYLLMNTHIHLLVTPETEDGLSKMMQAIGRRYARYFNDTNHRSGTLWEGRYKSTVIQAERHLLEAMTYLDLEPVTVGVACAASEYPWSSHAHYVGRRVDRLITSHPVFWHLGNTPFEREAAYAALVNQGYSEVAGQQLKNGLRGGWVWGSKPFIDEVASQTDRRVIPDRPGRPISPKNRVS